MTDFEFVIPLNKNDLLHKSGVNNYVVDEVFPVRLLPGKIKGICELIRWIYLHCVTAHC